MMDKLLGKPTILERFTYSQMVKRYTSTKTVPKDYDYTKEVKSGLLQKDIDNEDYIFTDKQPAVGDQNIKLPRYFPIENDNGTQWMMLRRPLALRLHKFKRKENAHEFCY